MPIIKASIFEIYNFIRAIIKRDLVANEDYSGHDLEGPSSPSKRLATSSADEESNVNANENNQVKNSRKKIIT